MQSTDVVAPVASLEGLRDHRLCVAPMVGWTDRHWRTLTRLITKKVLLTTEMTYASALYYNPEKLSQFLGHDPLEYPLSLQLGGGDPEIVSEAAYLASAYGGWSEINLNSGCPSTKAKQGAYGAVLMLNPQHTRQIVAAMVRKVGHKVPVSIKCRIGVVGVAGGADRASFEELVEFVDACKSAGANRFILHARNVVMRKLSPAQNRSLPPLQYDVVARLARYFPDLDIVLNGGVLSLAQAEDILTDYDGCLRGVMIGREAYRNPWLFVDADERYYGSRPRQEGWTRQHVLDEYLEYCDGMQGDNHDDNRTCSLIKPLHNFFCGCPEEHAYKVALNNALIVDKHRSVSEVILAVLQRDHDSSATTSWQSFLDEKV